MARKKKIKLTAYERSLLEHPPTEQTWVCRKRKTEDGTVIVHINAGSHQKCVYCGEPKSKKPTLIWTDYVSACEKVGIEPGYQYKIFEVLRFVEDKQIVVKQPMMKLKGESWQEIPTV